MWSKPGQLRLLLLLTMSSAQTLQRLPSQCSGNTRGQEAPGNLVQRILVALPLVLAPFQPPDPLLPLEHSTPGSFPLRPLAHVVPSAETTTPHVLSAWRAPLYIQVSDWTWPPWRGTLSRLLSCSSAHNPSILMICFFVSQPQHRFLWELVYNLPPSWATLP